MLMVHECQGIGLGENLPQVTKQDYLYRETMNERKAAMVIVDKIRVTFKLSWNKVKAELDTRPESGWYDPGEAVELEFLRGMAIHA
jgi:hypothetical protein